MVQVDIEDFSNQLELWKIKTVIVLQGEQLITEWYDRGEDTIGPLYSCTKSVLSALFGVALDKGFFPSMDQPITDYVAVSNELESSRSEIRLKHLLTMTPGFDWPDFDKPYKAMRAAEDPVQFVLMQPIISDPGTAFAYNSGASHLLSSILTKATGMSVLQFATEHLFEPLGFQSAKWSEQRGVNEGGTGLHLYGRDLAKIGRLFAQKGRWGDTQLLSTDWVQQSTMLHHRGLMQYDPPIYGGYGYHWWHSPISHNGLVDCYFAFGHGGQYLLIAPELDLTIVIRKQITKRNEAIFSRKLIFEHIIPLFIAPEIG